MRKKVVRNLPAKIIIPTWHLKWTPRALAPGPTRVGGYMMIAKRKFWTFFDFLTNFAERPKGASNTFQKMPMATPCKNLKQFAKKQEAKKKQKTEKTHS